MSASTVALETYKILEFQRCRRLGLVPAYIASLRITVLVAAMAPVIDDYERDMAMVRSAGSNFA
jgi:hypothetical protein